MSRHVPKGPGQRILGAQQPRPQIQTQVPAPPPNARPAWRQAIQSATKDLVDARQAADDEETAWRYAIREALQSGAPATGVAEAAGITRQRVYQIRDGRR